MYRTVKKNSELSKKKLHKTEHRELKLIMKKNLN